VAPSPSGRGTAHRSRSSRRQFLDHVRVPGAVVTSRATTASARRRSRCRGAGGEFPDFPSLSGPKVTTVPSGAGRPRSPGPGPAGLGGGRVATTRTGRLVRLSTRYSTTATVSRSGVVQILQDEQGPWSRRARRAGAAAPRTSRPEWGPGRRPGDPATRGWPGEGRRRSRARGCAAGLVRRCDERASTSGRNGVVVPSAAEPRAGPHTGADRPVGALATSRDFRCRLAEDEETNPRRVAPSTRCRAMRTRPVARPASTSCCA